MKKNEEEPKKLEEKYIEFLQTVHERLRKAKKDSLRRIAEKWDKDKAQLDWPKPESECPLPRTNLERKPDELIGRADEKSTARDELLKDELKVLTFTGLGGIGKTLLCKHVANSLRNEFKCKHVADGLQNESNDHVKDHIYFIELAEIDKDDPLKIVKAVLEIAKQLNIGMLEIEDEQDKDGKKRAKAQIENIIDHLSKENVREERLLLVLDNFEHVRGAATYVGRLVKACPEQVKILVTSRWLLGLGKDNEKEFPVEELSLPKDGQSLSSYEDLLKYGATKLFVEQSGGVEPKFALSKENAQIIVEICRSLSGIPFMIKVVAAKLSYSKTPQALHENLIDPKTGRLKLAWLTNKESGNDPDPRHKDALAITAWSYDLLPSVTKPLFLQLALFKGGFTKEAAEKVGNATGYSGVVIENGIETLIDDKLLEDEVQEGSHEPRYYMLEVVRECALDILDKTEEQKLKVENHYVNYYLEQIKEANSENEKVQLEAEQSNLREALRLALLEGVLKLGEKRLEWVICCCDEQKTISNRSHQ